MLGLRPVLDHLARPLDLLAGTTARGSRNLREVIAWSYRLLDENERRLLAALSVFVGDFDLAAIEVVADAIGVGSAPTVAANLVEASLIVVSDDAGPPRHRLLAVVRAFAAERLATSPDKAAAHLGHARWVHNSPATPPNRPSAPTIPPPFGRRRHQRRRRHGVQWSLASDHGELAARIAYAVCLCSHWRPGAPLLSGSAPSPRTTASCEVPAAASALAAGAAAALDQGDFAAAEDLAFGCTRTARSTTEEQALALLTLAVAALYRGQHDRCFGWLNDLLAVPGVPIGLRMDAEATAALTACYAGDLCHRTTSFVDRASVTAEVAGRQRVPGVRHLRRGRGRPRCRRPTAIQMLRTAVDRPRSAPPARSPRSHGSRSYRPTSGSAIDATRSTCSRR